MAGGRHSSERGTTRQHKELDFKHRAKRVANRERAGGSEYGGASGVARTETVAKTRLTTARVMSVVERMVKVAAAMAMKAVAVEATAAEPREVERVRRWRRWNLS